MTAATCLVALMAMAGGSARAAAVLPTGARVVRSDRAGTELELAVPEPRIAAGEHGARIAIPGYHSLVAEPGAPDLPGAVVLIAVPAGSTVRERVAIEPGASLRGVRPAPVPSPIRGDDRAPPSWEYREDADLDGRPFPATPVRVSPVMQLRDLDVVAVTIFPVVHDPALPGLRAARRVRVVIETAGGTGESRAPASALPAADRALYEDSVVNPEAALGFRRPPPAAAARAGARQPDGFESAATWVKLGVGERGLVAVTGVDLERAGVAIASIDPATVRIFWGGGLDPEPGLSPRSPFSPAFMQECAIQIEDGAEQGRLDAGDRIIFLGQGASGWRDDFTGQGFSLTYRENQWAALGIYWLTWGGRFSSPPRRMETRAAPPVAGAPIVSRGQARQHVEENREYYPALYEPGCTWEKWWFEEPISDREPPVIVDIATPDADPAIPGTLRARIWGWTAMGNVHQGGDIHDHYLAARWNDEPLHAPAGRDTFIWDGPWGRWQSGRLDIEATDLAFAERNELVLDALTIPDPFGWRIDESRLAWCEVLYTRRLDMAGALWLELATPPGLDGTVNFEITSAPGEIVVYDVTDPYAPVALQPEQADSTVRFAADLDPAAVRKVRAGPPTRYARCRTIEIDRSYPRLRDPANQARYLVIAHDDLIEPAIRLARAHPFLPGESTPALPMAVRVSDIYDEFGWGLKSDLAIRNFIDYATHAWSAGARPLYVCLVGDASSDPLGLGDEGTEEPGDPIPAPMFWNYIGGVWGASVYTSDDWYVRTFGDSLESAPDALTDLWIGRLPARTLDEAQGMVDEKTIAALAAPARGAWRQRIVLAADDDRAGTNYEGFLHAMQSERASAILPPELERVRVYLHDYPRAENGAKPEAGEAFIAAINQGAALACFVGHGAPDVLTHERFFVRDDVSRLENAEAATIFFAFSCTVSPFDMPARDSIGEALVKRSGGGCAATVGATDLSFSGGNDLLARETFARLYAEGDFTRPQPLGQALGAAKNVLAGADTTNNWKYVLLGDPALPPAAPAARLALAMAGGAGGETDTLAAGVPERVLGAVVAGQGGGPDPGAFGDALVRARDTAVLRFAADPGANGGWELGGRDLFRSWVPVRAGSLAAGFVVPIDAAPSATDTTALAEIRVYAQLAAGNADALGALAVHLDPGAVAPAEPPPAAGPSIRVTFDGDPRALLPGALVHVWLADPSGINLLGRSPATAIRMQIDDDLVLALNELFTYTPGSATEGVVDVRLPDLAEGEHQAAISAADSYLNRSRLEVGFAVDAADGARILGAALYPNPFRPRAGRGTVIAFEVTEPADAGVRIYTISGKLVRDLVGRHDADYLRAGRQQIHWDGRDEEGDAVANGVYLIKVEIEGIRSGERSEVLLRAVVSR